MRFTTVIFLFFLLSGCVTHKKESKVGDLELTDVVHQKPLTPEESKAMLKDVGSNWLYGQGIGNTSLQVGGIIIFPPYAFFVLGNSILDIAGYETIGIGTVLPKPAKERWYSFYDSATSGPGRFNAAIAGKEFVTSERAASTIKNYIKPLPPETKSYQPVSTAVEY